MHVHVCACACVCVCVAGAGRCLIFSPRSAFPFPLTPPLAPGFATGGRISPLSSSSWLRREKWSLLLPPSLWAALLRTRGREHSGLAAHG